MKTATIALLTLALFVVSPTLALASEAEQEQNQEVEVECTTSGQYGQDTTCKARGEQEQRQRILGVHTPVDTGSELAFLGMPLLLLGGAIAVRKIS